MKKIGIVVVTYNRKDKLVINQECLQRLKRHAGYEYHVYVIDNNSSDGTEKVVNQDAVHYIRLNENTGGAGGFKAGIKACVDDRMDCIWGMDDDAFPEEDSLYNLLEEYEKDTTACYWANCNSDNSFEYRANRKEVSSWMFVGFFLGRDIVEQIGYPRDDFFIFFDDSEYAQRIIRSGHKIYKIKNAVINHQDSANKNIKVFKIFGRPLAYYDLPDWKLYYLMRNELLRYRYRDRFFWSILIARFLHVFLYMYYNRKQVCVILTATLHGVMRKTGKNKKFFPG